MATKKPARRKTSNKKKAGKRKTKKVAKKRPSKRVSKAKNKGGRPSAFDPKMCEQAYRLCLLGATDKQMADFFEVSEVTLNAWKKKHPEFLKSLNAGKQQADSEVGQSLFQRAMGYSHPEEKVFCNKGEIVRADTVKHYPPDTTACIFWLKNRQKENWRDRHEVTGDDGGPLSVLIVDPTRAKD